jgi:peptidoglycan hydrolase-like protein with peptidoglycan-binding domain
VKLPRLLFLPSALLLAFFLPGLSQTAKKAPATAKAGSKTPVKASTKKKSSKSRAQPKRATQQQPSEERTREIQQALASKGYEVEPNGVWGPQSVEALKKFQEDQRINNMTGRGKLDSLTLIALGLGPRTEPPPASASPVVQAPTEGKQQ